MVYIAKYWTPRYTNLPVRVFSNCDSVCLYLNGTLVAEQTPDLVMQGFDKPLPVDHLLHAPFTFSTVSYQAGTLRAEGRIGGVIKSTHEVRTPETASKISVQIDTAGLPFLADGADVAFVYASVLDQNGTLVTTANNSIQFSVTGGTILGPSPQPAAAGIAVILLQTKTTAGEITVTAGSRGLTSGSASVTSVPYVDPSCVEAGTVFQPKAPSTQH